MADSSPTKRLRIKFEIHKSEAIEKQKKLKEIQTSLDSFKKLPKDMKTLDLVELNFKNVGLDRHPIYTMDDCALETRYGKHTAFYLATNYTMESKDVYVYLAGKCNNTDDEIESWVGLNGLPRHFFYLIDNQGFTWEMERHIDYHSITEHNPHCQEQLDDTGTAIAMWTQVVAVCMWTPKSNED